MRITIECDRGPSEGSVSFEIPGRMLAWTAEQKAAFTQFCFSGNGEVGRWFVGATPSFFSDTGISCWRSLYEVIERVDCGYDVTVRCRYHGPTLADFSEQAPLNTACVSGPQALL